MSSRHSPLSSVPWVRPRTPLPSFPASSRAGAAALPTLGAWSPRSSAETGGWKDTGLTGFRAAALLEEPSLFLVQSVPVFPVLGDPGLQLLPHSLEVFSEELLQLLPGDAVVVGAGQLVEVL